MTAKHKQQSIYDIFIQHGDKGEAGKNILQQYAKETGQR